MPPDPRLPHRFDELRFSLRFRDRQIRVSLAHDRETYLLDEGDPIEVTIRGQPHRLEHREPLTLEPPTPEGP